MRTARRPNPNGRRCTAAGIGCPRRRGPTGCTAAYREVLIHDPNNQFAYYNLGVIDQANGSLESADSNYGLALSIDPSYVPALYNLAIVKTAIGETKAEIDLYRSAILEEPEYAAAQLNLGFALIDDGQRKEGKAELATAVELDLSLASGSLKVL